MEFPIYNSSRRKGEAGLLIVQDIVHNALNWIFRRVSLEDDFGLDGYLDILKEGKYVTGKAIGVQVKTGSSYFDNPCPGGWIYYGDKKHFNYYANADSPVIIVIVNEISKECFWTEFDINRVTKTEKGWKIVIESDHSLQDKQLLSGITNDVVDYTVQLDNLAKIHEEIDTAGLIFVAVDREEIEKMNFTGFELMLKWLTASQATIVNSMGKISIAVFGYDDDQRELYQIEEVRMWMQGVFPIFKYWGYFLNMEKMMGGNSSLILLCACITLTNSIMEDENGRGFHVICDETSTNEFKNNVFQWLNEFAEKYVIEEKVVFEQSMNVLRLIDQLDEKEINHMRDRYGFQ